MPLLISKEEIDVMDSGDESDAELMSTEMLETFMTVVSLIIV